MANKYRVSTIVVVLVATIAAAVASVDMVQPWDMLSTVLAAVGAATILLLIAIRLQTTRRH